MAIQTISVRIEEIDEANDRFMLYTGGIGFSVSISEFKRLIQGAMVEQSHLIRNAALRAALSGADPDDMASIKTAVESGGFKI